ncbi:MAG: hypothetical protein ACN0LA_05105 [Candidatus Longimicrobiales bacterium M2_2A_002]
MRHASAWLAIPLLLAGCSTDDAAPAMSAAVDTVGGVERVAYPADPGPALDWPIDTVAVIGDAFAEDEYQFDQVSAGGLAADEAGSLYVLDRQGNRVLKYGRDGRHLATLGREGGGPGELSQPIALAVGPGDTVWVSDFSNGRITGYPQDGGDPRTIPFPGEGVIPGQRLQALDDGFITLMRPVFGIRMQAGRAQVARGDDEGAEAQDRPVLPVMRLTDSLETVDTLWATPEPPMDVVQLEAGGRVMVTVMSREFYPDFQWAGFPDGGIVVSDTAAYVLHFLDPRGRRVRTVARAPAPRATTEADRELARQRVREQSEGGGIRLGGGGPDEATRERMLEQRVQKMTFAELIPRIVDLRIDPEGIVWVGVSEETPGEVERIDLYDRSGALVGELRGVPFPDVFLGPDRIGVLHRDDLDVQQVVIMELGRTGDRVVAGH